MQNKLNELRICLSKLAPNGICAAFSGGVDSALLLTVLAELRAKTPFQLLAATFATPFQTEGETADAFEQASVLGIPIERLTADVLHDPILRDNPKDRCWHCKKKLFTGMRILAERHGLKHLLDGTNADDTKVFRPGRRALEELGVISPLAICGFTKADVRAAARELLVPAADRASSPCLATRFPYGTRLTDEALRRVEAGESYLKKLGMKVVRIRVHGDTARIETDVQGFEFAAGKRFEIGFALKQIGFPYAALDLEGFRSGSMDEPQPLHKTE